MGDDRLGAVAREKSQPDRSQGVGADERHRVPNQVVVQSLIPFCPRPAGSDSNEAIHPSCCSSLDRAVLQEI